MMTGKSGIGESDIERIRNRLKNMVLPGEIGGIGEWGDVRDMLRRASELVPSEFKGVLISMSDEAQKYEDDEVRHREGTERMIMALEQMLRGMGVPISPSSPADADDLLDNTFGWGRRR